MVETSKVAKWFLYAGVFNALFAVLITIPMVIPDNTGAEDLLRMAFAVAFFPGLYILMGYLGFLVVGVAGSVTWGAAYYIVGATGKNETSRGLAMAHLLLVTIGIYGVATFFFAGGYLGGIARLTGVVRTVEDAMTLITWTVMPRMLFIAIAIVGSLIGVINLLKTARSKTA
jgi:hypothetical protein